MANEVLVEKRDDRIAVITLNRPQALNAIDRAMVRCLREAIRDAETDPRVDIVVFVGAGRKAFCVGVDLKERRTLSDEEAQAFRMSELFPMYRELEEKQKPAIAMIHGHCLGGGFEIALCCDMIVASEDSTFGFPEVKWGLIPAGGGCRKLPKLIGAMRGKELILTGRTISARQAEQLGIVNHVIEGAAADESVQQGMQQTIKLAQEVLANVQLAIRGAKRSMDQALDWQRTMAFDLEIANSCYSTRERKDGIAEFARRKAGSAEEQ